MYKIWPRLSRLLEKFKMAAGHPQLEGFLDQVKDVAVENKEETKKRSKKAKYAVMLSYQGKQYFGMQVQKSEPTIESHLLSALSQAGFITEDEMARPNSFYFQRAARTDRGVSAVRQLCSMQLIMNEDLTTSGPQKMNSFLPKDIRVMGVRRVVPSFHAQKSCDSRTYSYTIPSFAFAELDKLTATDYRISSSRISYLNEVLNSYVGTHNFFNYTSRKDHDDRSCYRYIKSFECKPPFIYKDDVRNKDVEFVTIYVHGQSFILHQIRKMMGMVISVVRGFAYQSDVLKSFESKRMDVPRAPGLGLLLEKLHYDVYEKRFADTHGSLNDWGDETETAVLDFRNQYIVNEILKTECQTQQMMLWLSNLACHRFACDAEDVNGESVTELRDAYYTVKESTGPNTEDTDSPTPTTSAAKNARLAEEPVEVVHEEKRMRI